MSKGTKMPSAAQLAELIEAAIEAHAYIERVEASEENTRVGGRLFMAYLDITSPYWQAYLGALKTHTVEQSTGTIFDPDWTSSPGDTIRDLIEESEGVMTEERLADYLFSDAATRYRSSLLANLLEGRLPLDGTIAFRLADVFGPNPEFWERRELRYRLDQKRGKQ